MKENYAEVSASELDEMMREFHFLLSVRIDDIERRCECHFSSYLKDEYEKCLLMQDKVINIMCKCRKAMEVDD